MVMTIQLLSSENKLLSWIYGCVYFINACVYLFYVQHEGMSTSKVTRKLSYRKDDREMRPMYGCPENFRESLTTPTATFPEIFNGLLFRLSL